MIGHCEWTPERLANEIIADLESLQGMSVDWEKVWPYSTNEFLIRLFTADEKEFEMRILITDVQS